MEALVKAGVDAIVIDTAHGHTAGVVNVLKAVKEAFPETECLTLDLGAAFVTQGGPGCIAIQYIEKRK